MMKTNSTIKRMSHRAGQSAVEVALGLLAFAFVVSVFVAFAKIFIVSNETMDWARQDAGEGALNSFASCTLDLREASQQDALSLFQSFLGQQRDIQGMKAESVEADLFLGSINLFDDEIQIKELVLMPALGGL